MPVCKPRLALTPYASNDEIVFSAEQENYIFFLIHETTCLAIGAAVQINIVMKRLIDCATEQKLYTKENHFTLFLKLLIEMPNQKFFQ